MAYVYLNDSLLASTRHARERILVLSSLCPIAPRQRRAKNERVERAPRRRGTRRDAVRRHGTTRPASRAAFRVHTKHPLLVYYAFSTLSLHFSFAFLFVERLPVFPSSFPSLMRFSRLYARSSIRARTSLCIKKIAAVDLALFGRARVGVVNFSEGRLWTPAMSQASASERRKNSARTQRTALEPRKDEKSMYKTELI